MVGWYWGWLGFCWLIGCVDGWRGLCCRWVGGWCAAYCDCVCRRVHSDFASMDYVVSEFIMVAYVLFVLGVFGGVIVVFAFVLCTDLWFCR